METDSVVPVRRPHRFSIVVREFNTLIAATMAMLVAYILARELLLGNLQGDWHAWASQFVGPSWPFFAAVACFLFWVIGAWLVEAFGLGVRREWDGIAHALHWATEASPLVGLLATFASLLTALLAYSAAGPGNPETQAVFIQQFAIAFGSSIAGGVMALTAFTLHRTVPHNQ